MLTRPEISDDDVAVCLKDSFGLDALRVTFLPVNVDIDCAVFRVSVPDGTPYLLKLQRRARSDTPLRVAAFLRGQGIRAVLAPLTTTAGELPARAHGFTWLLYPFFEGRTALQAGMSRTQWIALGACMRAVHATSLPQPLAERVPSEDFAPHWRALVKAFPERMARLGSDPLVERMARFWEARGDAIEQILVRAEQLARTLPSRPLDRVLCHSDLHGNNVLVGSNDDLRVIDWDEPVFAPKERDLMFIGGGVGGAWNQAQEAEWFYEGYRPRSIDRVILAYYRYERIVEDVAAYGARILNMEGSAEDRAEGLRRMASVFLPGNVAAMADRSYPY